MLRTLLATSLILAAGALTAQAADFKLTSKTIAEGASLSAAQVFEGFGCTGGNFSPDLAWTGAPEGTKSFAITAYDPDAPTGSGWWHWNVVNLPAATTTLAAARATLMPCRRVRWNS